MGVSIQFQPQILNSFPCKPQLWSILSATCGRSPQIHKALWREWSEPRDAASNFCLLPVIALWLCWFLFITVDFYLLSVMMPEGRKTRKFMCPVTLSEASLATQLLVYKTKRRFRKKTSCAEPQRATFATESKVLNEGINVSRENTSTQFFNNVIVSLQNYRLEIDSILYNYQDVGTPPVFFAINLFDSVGNLEMGLSLNLTHATDYVVER